MQKAHGSAAKKKWINCNSLYFLTMKRTGFTLMELLIIIGIISILIAITLSAINPNKQLNDARNAFRMSANVQIENAVWQYIVDGNTIATVPASKATAIDICKETYTGSTCTNAPVHGYDLSILAPKYIVSLPVDTKETNPGLTGFRIYANGTIIKICSAKLENDCGA